MACITPTSAPPASPITRFLSLPLLAIAFSALAAGSDPLPARPAKPTVFQPTWQSLEAGYQCPEWFRDAKFGIWAHWGPQTQPEQGDWYARRMYVAGEPQHEYHISHYGHPSKVGFKDLLRQWKAERFDPDQLLAFYKQSGARYFMALANHHDNFDNFNSKYQPWNSVNLGPQKDLIGLWAAAARKHELRFGVSVHASRAWSWYEPARGADLAGPLAGVPYDGRLTKGDGKGQWWDGLDPQELYAQDHAAKAPPSPAYVEKFFQRTRQLIDDYRPDLVYFDDGVLPMRKHAEAAGLELVAHYYNQSQRWHGRNEAVVNSKSLDEAQRRALVYDIERGKAEAILPEPWQTDTCIGEWHYRREIFEKHQYKTAAVVIPMLVEIVSRNGNLMLSVPVRADGTIDEDEIATLRGVGDWLAVNGDAIYATRPWKIYGEGPSTTEKPEANRFGGAKDVRTKAYTSDDIRFTQSKDGSVLYAIALAAPTGRELAIKSFARGTRSGAALLDREVAEVTLVGSRGLLKWMHDGTALRVELPATLPSSGAFSIRVLLRDSDRDAQR